MFAYIWPKTTGRTIASTFVVLAISGAISCFPPKSLDWLATPKTRHSVCFTLFSTCKKGVTEDRVRLPLRIISAVVIMIGAPSTPPCGIRENRYRVGQSAAKKQPIATTPGP